MNDYAFVDGAVRPIRVTDGRVAWVGPVRPVPRGATVWSPSFVDLHCHGARGFGFDDADDRGLADAVGYHRTNGTGMMLLSLVSAPVAQLTQRLRSLRSVIPFLPGVVGVHLEGPFLAADRCGAHDPNSLVNPSPAVVTELLSASGGMLKQITIAPELPGAAEATAAFVDEGVVVAVGHTNATYDQAAAAFDRGASLLTHAFNAMRGLDHREPGPVGAALSRNHVALEVIADGVHVHPIVVRTLFDAAGSRIVLVTDAMSAAGLGDGRYSLGGIDVDVTEGRPTMRGTDTLAGSTLTMAHAVQMAIGAGVPPELAIGAATDTPTRVLGLRATDAIDVGTNVSTLNCFRDGVRVPVSSGEW